MDYDVEKMRLIAAKYFEGASSDEEEALLRNYFRETRDVPQDLKSLASMMLAFRSMSGERMPSRCRRPIFRVALCAVAAAAAVLLAVLVPSSRTVFGYDSEGRPITSRHEVAMCSEAAFSDLSALGLAMDSAEELLSMFDED